ncbi:MAG: transporter substrate-binding domain-containing protein [Desulfobacteraceae bacterium]|nr:transporter substrate-binding domain-containing protein [Desulfobacteraceae bacterium]
MKRFTLYIILAVLSINSVCFGETITFGTFPIPKMVLDENHGNFIELTRAISERAGIDIEIVVKPTKRTIQNFKLNETDVLFPALDVNFSPENQPIKSGELLYVKRDYIFTRKGDPLLRSIKELECKKVGITLGYPYARKLTGNSLIEFDMAHCDEINVLKLTNKRFDAFVVEETTGLKAFQDKGASDEVQYDPDSPISEMDVYYAFQNTKKGKWLAEVVTIVLSEMKQDGTFSEIIDK